MSTTNGWMDPQQTLLRRPRLGWGQFPRRAADRVRLWLDLWSERRTLRGLDTRALADLGLTPADVRLEAMRPFYDVPRGR